MSVIGKDSKQKFKKNEKYSKLLNNLSIHAYSKLVEQHKTKLCCGRCSQVPEKVCYFSKKCRHVFCEMCVKEDPFFGICPSCGEVIQKEDLVIDPTYWNFYQCYKHTSNHECSGKFLLTEYLSSQKPQKYDFLLQEECRKLFTRNSTSSKNSSDYENIKLLLNYGANPNVLNKDGWTLLHEAVDYSHVEVLELLLLGGGLVNAYSLDRITTCLHDALDDECVNMNIINVLLAHGADIEARDRTGLTAKRKAEMKNIDLVERVKLIPKYTDITIMHRPDNSMLLYGSLLSDNNQKLLNDFCQKFKIKQCPRSKVSKEVTHIIVENDPCTPTFAVNFGILQGCHILTFMWISDCLEAGSLLPFAPYEVNGTKSFPNSGVPKKSRMNSALLQPKLFAGGQFNISDNSNRLSAKQKEEVIDLITAGGGKVLTRSNSCGESIGESFFYHAHGGPLQNCTVIVLHKAEPRDKSWETIGHFSLKWLYKAIQTFQIVP